MSASGLDTQLEQAKQAAREQWHMDLQAARERYSRAIAAAEAEYEARRRERVG